MSLSGIRKKFTPKKSFFSCFDFFWKNGGPISQKPPEHPAKCSRLAYEMCPFPKKISHKKRQFSPSMQLLVDFVWNRRYTCSHDTASLPTTKRTYTCRRRCCAL